MKFHQFTRNRNPESCFNKLVKLQQKKMKWIYLGPLLSLLKGGTLISIVSYYYITIELMINKLHGLSPSGGLVSPSGGFASLFFDQVEYFASIKLCQALSHQGQGASCIVPWSCRPVQRSERWRHQCMSLLDVNYIIRRKQDL